MNESFDPAADLLCKHKVRSAVNPGLKTIRRSRTNDGGGTRSEVISDSAEISRARDITVKRVDWIDNYYAVWAIRRLAGSRFREYREMIFDADHMGPNCRVPVRYCTEYMLEPSWILFAIIMSKMNHYRMKLINTFRVTEAFVHVKYNLIWKLFRPSDSCTCIISKLYRSVVLIYCFLKAQTFQIGVEYKL